MKKNNISIKHLFWWKKFYKQNGIEINYSDFSMPKRPAKGKYWAIIVAPITYMRLLEILRKKFEVALFLEGIDLDQTINQEKEQRRAIKAYGIWVEAKETPELIPNNSSAITLKERLLLEAFCIDIAKGRWYLDDLITGICSGSHYKGKWEGFVPVVHYEVEGVFIDASPSSSPHKEVLSRKVWC